MQTSQSGVPALQFQNTHFDVVDRNGTPWLRGFQIGNALGYADPAMVLRLYHKHADEFTADMTALVKLPTEGGVQEVRIFSPRGCYALGMFARTQIAAEFRKWVLDVLEGKHAVPPAPTFPTMADALTLYRESVQALLLTQPMQQAHTLACKSASRATGIDLESLWVAPPIAPLPLHIPGPDGTIRIARPIADVKAKILRVVRDARRYRAAAYYGLTRQGVMPYGYAMTLCKVPAEQFRQLVDEMLAAGTIRQAPPDIYMGGMMCFVAGGAA